ncbi:MAG: hypothetical protein AABX28_01575 [Nanoarchaeota archaeon]
MRKRDGKRGIISDYLPWILIALAILVVMLLAIFILKEKGASVVEQIKNLFGSR